MRRIGEQGRKERQLIAAQSESFPRSIILLPPIFLKKKNTESTRHLSTKLLTFSVSHRKEFRRETKDKDLTLSGCTAGWPQHRWAWSPALWGQSLPPGPCHCSCCSEYRTASCTIASHVAVWTSPPQTEACRKKKVNAACTLGLQVRYLDLDWFRSTLIYDTGLKKCREEQCAPWEGSSQFLSWWHKDVQ